MPKIAWSEDLSVKIARFDNEHKKLIDMLNKLNEAMSQGQGQALLSGILVDLATYTKTHFKHEEEAMEKCKYHGYVEHKRQHTDFIQKIQEMHEDFKSGKTSITIQVFNFLNSWVQNHIKTIDKKYSEYLQ